MVGRSLSKYSNKSKISINQMSGPNRDMMQRTNNIRAFSNDAARIPTDSDIQQQESLPHKNIPFVGLSQVKSSTILRNSKLNNHNPY
jgi:negative regulator of sigma E activity